MTQKLLTFYSCQGPVCNSTLPAPVILCVPWEKVAPHTCAEGAEAGEQPFQYSYIEGDLVEECFIGDGCVKQWKYAVSYDDEQLNAGYSLLGGDILGIACKDCIGQYADQRAGDEIYVETDEFGAQTLVTQHGCRFVLTASAGVVQSVFGRVGNVTAQANDYTWAQVDKTVSDIADITDRSHTDLTDIGVNTHPQIDAHIASVANPHATTATQVGLGNVTNDAQLKRAAGDFNSFAQKIIPAGADIVLIEDSGLAFAKRKVTFSSLFAALGAVTSVFGRAGAVVAQANDYTWAQINKAVSNIADITNRSHTDLTSIGINTHAQIDTHIASVANPHAVTATQVGLGNVTDDAQLKRAAGDFSTFAAKAVPVAADVLLIEDSAAAGAKKSITLANLPRSYTEVTATADASTSSAAYVVITGMTITPAAGTYRATFSSSFAHSNNGVLANYAIHVNGVAVAHSERNFQTAGGAENAVHTQAIVTVTGVEAVDVRYKTAANTVTAHERSLILERLTA